LEMPVNNKKMLPPLNRKDKGCYGNTS